MEDFDFDNILIGKKLYENVLIYGILYEALIDKKPWRIKVDKTDGFIRIYGGTYMVELNI